MGRRSRRLGRCGLWLAAAISTVAIAACDETADSGSQDASTEVAETAAPVETTSAPACAPANADLVASLESSLTTRGSLKSAQYVEVTDGPDAPLAAFQDGAFIVSAQLDAAGIEGTTMSWGVSEGMVDTGGGLAFGLDEVTREFSDAGADAADGSPARDYSDALKDTDAYDQSRDCAKDG